MVPGLLPPPPQYLLLPQVLLPWLFLPVLGGTGTGLVQWMWGELVVGFTVNSVKQGTDPNNIPLSSHFPKV